MQRLGLHVAKQQRAEEKIQTNAEKAVAKEARALSDKVDAVLRVIKSYGKDSRGAWKMGHKAAELREPLEAYFNTIGRVAAAPEIPDIYDALTYPVNATDADGNVWVEPEVYQRWVESLLGQGDAENYVPYTWTVSKALDADLTPGLWLITRYVAPDASGPRDSILR
ncbi:MAG: hypothetical protein P1V36_17895, partial [Planctomycetota bacterium]|nr:hypothetical protein [Planctomycetota bacterium]